MADLTDADSLLGATGVDTRYVAVIWRNDDDGDGRPQLLIGGCSEFEAIGLLRASLVRLERDCRDLIDTEDDDEEDDDDDD